MKTETSIVARQYRLMEWAEQIRDCKARPSGMSVTEWCSMHDISTANYYYRFSQVRKACLEQVQEEPVKQSVVPVQIEQLKKETQTSNSSLELNVNGIVTQVTESTSDELLKKVLQVIADVKSRIPASEQSGFTIFIGRSHKCEICKCSSLVSSGAGVFPLWS